MDKEIKETIDDSKLYKLLHTVENKLKVLEALANDEYANAVDIARYNTLREVKDYIKLLIGDRW